MKTQLIKLQDKFILVSDEEAKYPDYVWNGEHILGIAKVFTPNGKKIIAGIPEIGKSIYNREAHEIEEGLNKLLPTVDFSLLSEEDCKKIGFVEVEKLAISIVDRNTATQNQSTFDRYKFFVKEGFKKAQSINDNIFSLEDMKTAYDSGMSNIDSDGCAIGNCNEDFNDIIQSLQKTEWEVEVEMISDIPSMEVMGEFESRPKITNNSIKVLRIL